MKPVSDSRGKVQKSKLIKVAINQNSPSRKQNTKSTPEKVLKLALKLHNFSFFDYTSNFLPMTTGSVVMQHACNGSFCTHLASSILHEIDRIVFN